jgi:hypothetical protein
MQKQTTIRVSSKLIKALSQFKVDNKDTYEDIIWDFIEPHLELSDEAKKDIVKSKEQYKRGEVFTLEEIKEEFGLK